MKQILAVIILMTMSVFSHAKQGVKFDSDKGTIEFLAKGPLVKVKGHGAGAKGDLQIVGNKVSGLLELNLKSLKTGISLRDNHMKSKYLQVDQFPVAVLKIKEVALPDNLKGKADFEGELNLHGITKNIKGRIKLKGIKSGKVQMNADFKIKFSDFGIELPSFKLVSVGEEIAIKVKSKVIISEDSSQPNNTALVPNKQKNI